ncbi:MAG: Hint domain-containing protein [Rhodobacteraceae bacterium]|nr:Hint domain-containing protein [Paracoccaceae bacterium]
MRDTTWTLPGFVGTSKITTSFGDLPIQAMRLRDPLRTPSGAIATVAWVNKVHLDEEFLRTHPDARPILIRAGSLGPNKPEQDLIVSPHQRIDASPVQFRQEYCLARDLEDRPGVLRQPVTVLTYYLFHCTMPVGVKVDGVWANVLPG